MSSRFAFRLTCGAVLTVLGLAVSAVALATWHDRSMAIDNGVREARNTAIMLSGQIERSIQSVDLVIRDVQALLVGFGLQAAPTTDGLPAVRALQGPLTQLRDGLPHAHQIAVADRWGRLVAVTASSPTPKISIADRDYFIELAANSDDRLAVSLPIENRVTGETVIVLARRIASPDGSFRGIVLVSVKKSYFEQLYGAIARLPHQTFTLLRRDGTVLIRFPSQQDSTGRVIPASSPFHKVVAEGGGSIRSNSLFGRSETSWIAIAPLKDYPLVANITIPQDVVLRDWQSRLTVTAVVTVAVLACALFLLGIFARQFRRISASEAQLAENQVRLLDSETALRAQNQRFDAALNNMTQGLAMFDRDARLVVCNHRFRDINGLSAAQTAAGRSLRDIIADAHDSTGFPAHVDEFLADVARIVSAAQPTIQEITDSDDRTLAIRTTPFPDGGWVVTLADVTERRVSADKLRFLAHHDVLTGLANRSHFLEQIADLHRRLATAGHGFSVFVLDLDRFKRVNDIYGHAAGDQLLQEAGRRLQASVRVGDVVARIGGDEFAILQTPPRSAAHSVSDSATMKESAIALANRIIALIGEPFVINDEKVFVGTSIGIALAPDHGCDPDELLKRADLALYRAKAEGRNGYSFFDDRLAAEDAQRRRLGSDLRTALARNEFEVQFQPFVETATGRLCGLEALVRWRHPEYGVITPDRFLVLADDIGLVASLGEWILQTACTAAVGWPDDVKLAVNLSPIQFRKPDLFDTIVCTLVDTGLPAERLEIEISERVLLEGDSDWLSMLHQLRNLGVAIVLDDFGTGQSSLGYLKMFPFDKIKLDRELTREIDERSESAAIICAMISVGRSLSITMAAEGVENSAQYDLLRAAGVAQTQGFLIGYPQPAAKVSFDADGRWDGFERPIATRGVQ